MNVFDLSPAQIRNRLILRARRAALTSGTGRQPPSRRPHGRAEAAAVALAPVVPPVSVAAGDVVQLAESDYRHSDGPLRLRIVRVRPDLSEWYDGEWVWLEGVEIGPDDQDGTFRPVLARVAALRPKGSTASLNAAPAASAAHRFGDPASPPLRQWPPREPPG
ncbi:hypothetical protein [Micromonospora sp. NPDC049374]|uniref:hypothetical protein n=1 Tax=Micromonospora sp. NPDC049374 TaxID=3154352 RepID=UPI0034165D86